MSLKCLCPTQTYWEILEIPSNLCFLFCFIFCNLCFNKPFRWFWYTIKFEEYFLLTMTTTNIGNWDQGGPAVVWYKARHPSSSTPIPVKRDKIIIRKAHSSQFRKLVSRREGIHVYTHKTHTHTHTHLFLSGKGMENCGGDGWRGNVQFLVFTLKHDVDNGTRAQRFQADILTWKEGNKVYDNMRFSKRKL